MMNNNKILSPKWAILPLLFCSAAVLAGDGGIDGSYGQTQTPPPAQSSLALEDDAAVAAPPMAATPDTMSQAQDLGKQSDGFLEDSTETASAHTGYVGGKARIGVGVDTKLKGKAEGSSVIHENASSATIGQGYVGFNPNADKKLGEESLTGAGAQVSHNWVSGDPNNATHVNKVFGAYDQNEQKDKKATVGYGQENANLFWSGQVSKGLSKARGTTTPGVSEKAYDLGVGGHVGTYLPDQQMRVQGGLDYEWGTDFANSEKRPSQTTLTGGVEKFFPDSPHSVGANVEVYKKSGGVVANGSDGTDARGGISYRYDIGSEAGIWQPEQRYRRIRTEIPGEQIKQPPKIERKLVKNTMELESDTFFKLGRAELTPEAQERMKAVIGQIRASGHDGNIRITGNTCDKGSNEHNQKLSERRANTVRDFMIKNGFNGDELLAQGLGETHPKYPNTPAEGHKNRRVDIEYVTYQNEYKDEVIEQGGTSAADPKVVWRKELIPEPPLWVRQALHNVIDHKQTVDTYKTTASTGGGTSANAPVAANDSATTTVGTPVTVDVLANDTDPNGDVLSIVSFNQGANGAVTQTGNKLVYTPVAGFTGTDTFTYVIKDPAGHQATATVTITVVAAASNAPVAVNDTATTTSGTPVNIAVLANDTGPNGNTLSIVSFNQGANGAVTQVGNNLVYTPVADFTGTDTFTYMIKDPAGHQATATVTVTVGAVNPNAPVVNNEMATTTVSTPVTIDVLANDTAPNHDTLSVAGFSPSSNGTVTQDGNKLVYTPRDGFTGTDTFTYIATDPAGNRATATVTVNVTATTPNAPLAVDDVLNAVQATPTTITVLSNDSAPNGETLSVASVGTAAHGTVAQNGNSVVYTPAAGFTGDDQFTYTIKDGAGNTATATVFAHVTAAGGDLSARNDLYTVNKNSSDNVLDVMSNDDVPANSNVTVTIISAPAHGTASVADTVVNYTPTTDFTGTDQLTYRLTDSKGATSETTVDIKIAAGTDANALKVTDDYLLIDLNDTVTKNLDVLANDSGDALTIIAVSTPHYGTARISADGKSINYTLRSGYCADHSFTYVVRDKNGNEAQATVVIDVAPANVNPNSPPA